MTPAETKKILGKKMAQSLLTAIKERHPDEFTRDDALHAYAASLELSGTDALHESQKMHVGRLLAKLSKQHDILEIHDRFVFPKGKDTYH